MKRLWILILLLATAMIIINAVDGILHLKGWRLVLRIFVSIMWLAWVWWLWLRDRKKISN